MKSIKHIVGWFIGLVFLFGCGEGSNDEGRIIRYDKPMVTVQELQKVPVVSGIRRTGLLRSDSQVKLSFKTTGYIQTIYVEEGEEVAKGELLGQLNLTEINSKVREAESRYNQISRDFERLQSLYRDSAITLQQFENGKMAWEISKTNLDLASFNSRHSSIVAPFDGKILKKLSEQNELVSPGQPIFILGSTGKAGNQVISLGVTDKNIGKIFLGDSALVHFDPYPDRPFRARVTRIGEIADPLTGTFDVEVTLNAYHDDLKNGFVATVDLFPKNSSERYQIPFEALVQGSGFRSKIFLTDDRLTAYSKQVPVSGFRDGFFLVPKEAIDPSSWIILEGAAYLREWDSITIKD